MEKILQPKINRHHTRRKSSLQKSKEKFIKLCQRRVSHGNDHSFQSAIAISQIIKRKKQKKLQIVAQL